MSRAAFEHLVEDYDAARPGYPDHLFAALPPLAGRRVVELGAGTGLTTRGLVAAVPDVDALVAAERASPAEAFPDGRMVEPFAVHLVLATRA